MGRITYFAAAATLAAALAACSDQLVSTQPQAPVSADRSVAASVAAPAAGMDRMITMMDACDHDTFEANGIDCIRNGGVSFDEFLSQLQAHQMVGAWRNSPSTTSARVGSTLIAVNRGGEVHTFTKVAHFGGGIVPILNQLSGTPVPAPECLAETNFIPPGGTDNDDVVTPGTTLYQCCIHPWMRTVVTSVGS